MISSTRSGDRPQGAVGSAPRHLPHRRHRQGQRARRHRAAPRAGQRQPQADHALHEHRRAATSPTGSRIHDAIRLPRAQGVQVTVVVQGMAYSMGSIVLQAASPGRRLAFPHSWIMIHEPAKWAGLAIDDRRGAAPRSPQADAEPDLPHPLAAFGQAAPADHPRHEAHRLLPRCDEGARLRLIDEILGPLDDPSRRRTRRPRSAKPASTPEPTRPRAHLSRFTTTAPESTSHNAAVPKSPARA